jgi:hypothetical protein
MSQKIVYLIGSGARALIHQRLAEKNNLVVRAYPGRFFLDNGFSGDMPKASDLCIICTRWDKNIAILNKSIELNLGCKVYVEKPVFIEAGEEIRALKSNIDASVLYDRRHYDTVQYFRRLVNETSSQRWAVKINFSDDYVEKNNRFNFPPGLNYLRIFFCHIVDFLNYCFGEFLNVKLCDHSGVFRIFVSTLNSDIEISISDKSIKKTEICAINNKGALVQMNGFEELIHSESGLIVNLIKSEVNSGIEKIWKIYAEMDEVELPKLQDDLIVNNFILKIISEKK